MEGLKQVRDWIQKDTLFCSMDLKDAFWHLSVEKSFRKFRSFCYKGRAFRFRAMPFGLAIALSAFAAMMNFPMSLVRGEGITALNYLEDFIVFAPTSQEWAWALSRLKDVVSSLGFILNLEMCLSSGVSVVKTSLSFVGSINFHSPARQRHRAVWGLPGSSTSASKIVSSIPSLVWSFLSWSLIIIPGRVYFLSYSV